MIFLAVAVAMALIYALWTLWVPLLPSNLYVPLLDLGKITAYTWSSAALYLLMVLLLYALYAVGYRASRSTSLKWIIAAAAVFAALLVFAYPATAVDVFGYIAHGRLLAVHHANPFTTPPNAFPSDAILSFLAFPDEPSQYGPIWVLIGGGIASIAQGNLLVEVLLYKALAALAHLLGGVAIYQIAWSLTRQETRARTSAYLYLCNPLLLWEMVGNAHNDGLMMLFGLCAVWLFVRGYNLLVLPALTAGALVKAPIAAIGPIMLIGLLRRGWARAVEGLALAAALAFVVYRPFWEGPQTLTALKRTDLFTASIGSVLRLALEPTVGMPQASTVARTASQTAFVVVAVLAVFIAVRGESDADVLRAAYVMLLGALLLLTTWFQAWYIVWPLALGAALGDPRRHIEVALLSLGGLLQYFVFIYLWVIGVFPPVENLGVQAAAYAAIIGPLVLALAARWAATFERPRARARGVADPSLRSG